MKLFTHAITSIAITVAAVFTLAGGLGIVLAFAGGTPTFAGRMHLIPNRARLIQGQTILPPNSYEPSGVTLRRQGVSLTHDETTLVAYVHIDGSGEIELHGPTKGSSAADIWLTGIGPTPDTSWVIASAFFRGPMFDGGSPGSQSRLVPDGWYFVTLSYSDAGGGDHGPPTGEPLSVTQNGRPLVPYWPAGH